MILFNGIELDPTLSVVTPLVTVADVTTPLTEVPLEFKPVTFLPIKVPAVATLCPKATDCNVVLSFGSTRSNQSPRLAASASLYRLDW